MSPLFLLLTALAPTEAHELDHEHERAHSSKWIVEVADTRCFLLDEHTPATVARVTARYLDEHAEQRLALRSSDSRIRAARVLICGAWYRRMDAFATHSATIEDDPRSVAATQLALELLDGLGGPATPPDALVGDGLIPADLHALRGFAIWLGNLASEKGWSHEHERELRVASDKTDHPSRWAHEALATVGDSNGCGQFYMEMPQLAGSPLESAPTEAGSPPTPTGRRSNRRR